MKSGRGGSREGAGRKSSWKSGCRQEETKLIRVPQKLAEELNEIAHRLDAGEAIDLNTKSIKDENEDLKRQVISLKQQFAQASDEVKRLKSLQQSRSTQLDLFTANQASGLPVKEELVKMRDRCLKKLPAGKQSKQYTHAKEAFDEFIETLLSKKMI